jgi:hypothetical protein
MKINSKWLAGITFLVIFGGISITTLLGWWQTESTKVPEKYVSGDYTEEYNPADIRGSYTFGEVSRIFEIPLADLKTAFALPYDDISPIGLNQLEEIFAAASDNGMEIGTSSVQLFTAYYLGLPYDALDEYLPEPALSVLLKNGNLQDEQLAYLRTHLVAMDTLLESMDNPLPSNESTELEGIPLETEEHSETDDTTIKGNTTFRELLDWGIPQTTIEEILGNTMPNALLTVKDYCLENGLSFGEIKESLQQEIPAQ